MTEEVAPAEKKVRELIGREKEPELGRIEVVRERLAGRARGVLREVRATVGSYRGRVDPR